MSFLRKIFARHEIPEHLPPPSETEQEFDRVRDQARQTIERADMATTEAENQTRFVQEATGHIVGDLLGKRTRRHEPDRRGFGGD